MTRVVLDVVITLLFVASVVAVAVAGAGDGDGDGEQGSHGTTWPSRGDAFRVSYTSRLEPIVINRIHSWVLHVETATGEPLDGAGITVGGGMPKHDHGLPTAPEATRNLGGGNYLVEGLRFHMNGYWELEFTITAGGETDTVVIPLTL